MNYSFTWVIYFCEIAPSNLGISTESAFFKSTEAVTLKKCIEEAYAKGGYEELFWDDVVNANLDKLKLKVKPVEDEDIVEIDTVEELEEVNKRFK